MCDIVGERAAKQFLWHLLCCCWPFNGRDGTWNETNFAQKQLRHSSDVHWCAAFSLMLPFSGLSKLARYQIMQQLFAVVGHQIDRKEHKGSLQRARVKQISDSTKMCCFSDY